MQCGFNFVLIENEQWTTLCVMCPLFMKENMDFSKQTGADLEFILMNYLNWPGVRLVEHIYRQRRFLIKNHRTEMFF